MKTRLTSRLTRPAHGWGITQRAVTDIHVSNGSLYFGCASDTLTKMKDVVKNKGKPYYGLPRRPFAGSLVFVAEKSRNA